MILMSNQNSKLPVFEMNFWLNLPMQASNGLEYSRVSPYGPHKPFEQVHWFAGKTDLARSPLSIVGFLENFGF